jgi:hypothetical protein
MIAGYRCQKRFQGVVDGLGQFRQPETGAADLAAQGDALSGVFEFERDPAVFTLDLHFAGIFLAKPRQIDNKDRFCQVSAQILQPLPDYPFSGFKG